MIRILFVCHGNICRSPMAEFVMRDLIAKSGLSDAIEVASAATSIEEIGQPVHPGTKKILQAHGISTGTKCAVQLTASDVDRYDYWIGMDNHNIRSMRCILGMPRILGMHHRILGQAASDRIRLLLSFCGETRDIADPWYTGDFQQTYRDVLNGCTCLLAYLVEHSL